MEHALKTSFGQVNKLRLRRRFIIQECDVNAHKGGQPCHDVTLEGQPVAAGKIERNPNPAEIVLSRLCQTFSPPPIGEEIVNILCVGGINITLQNIHSSFHSEESAICNESSYDPHKGPG